MLTKEKFSTVMKKLEEINEKENLLNGALRNFSSDFGGFSLGEVMPLFIEILMDDLGDKDEWLSYFVFEKDFLREFKEGDIQVKKNGKWEDVRIEDWGDVYEFLF